ncbi:MAG TPA: hypothetical protein PKD10_16895 [Paracoccaceae bacterium]|nr:hypothetical protein [Paracoccaceae bacterium]
MLSVEEMEAIEMRNLQWLHQELLARGVIKPEAKTQPPRERAG